jgi:hypothetical protein
VDLQKFNKIPRLSRECIITEKIDGTNGQIVIIRFNEFWNLHEKYAKDSVEAFLEQHCLYKTLALQDENDILYMFAGSRNKWLDCSSKGDNMGFAKWVKENASSLLMLGEGRHYGEWYGKGIQRNYGLEEKRLLFLMLVNGLRKQKIVFHHLMKNNHTVQIVVKLFLF